MSLINDVVLKTIHSHREDEHDECDLQRLATLGPAQGPVADPWQPGQQSEEEPDEELHAHQAGGVDQQLFEEPWPAGRAAVVTRVDGFRGLRKWSAKESLVEDLEEEEEDGNTDGGLKEWSVGKIAT